MDDNAIQLWLTVATISIVGAATLPGIAAIFAQIRSRRPKNNFYEDADGVSPPEAVAAFSNKRPKTAIVLLSAAGLAVSATGSVLATNRSHRHDSTPQNWLLTANWAAVLVQSVCIAAHRSSVQSQHLSVYAIFSSFFNSATLGIKLILAESHQPAVHDICFQLRAAVLVIAIALVFACALLPRRPIVYYRNSPVDGQWTVSVLSRYTWSWTTSILALARKKGDLDEHDLPHAAHAIRADNLITEWRRLNYHGPILSSLFRAYGMRLVLQLLMSILRNLLGIGPFWVMLRLIRILEHRDPMEPATANMWALIVALGIFSQAEQWLANWVVWFAYTMLSLPIRAQLTGLIFAKSLRE